MPDHNREIGAEGEQLAAEFLMRKGYTILSRNQRFGRAEVDLIACIGNETVFVEVKTRNNNRHGYPEESIDAKKIEMLTKAAEAFTAHNPAHKEIRFDLIAISGKGLETTCIHIEDAFIPGTNWE